MNKRENDLGEELITPDNRGKEEGEMGWKELRTGEQMKAWI